MMLMVNLHGLHDGSGHRIDFFFCSCYLKRNIEPCHVMSCDIFGLRFKTSDQ